MNIVVIALGSIALSVLAQFLLKAGMSDTGIRVVMDEPLGFHTAIAVFSNLKVLAGFALYGIGAIVWLSVLAKWDVSKAYPMVGVGFALTTMIGILLGEQVTALRILGVVLICAGVVTVSQS